MRIAIIQEHVETQRGGAETSTLEMAGQLAALDLDVTIVCRGPTAVPMTQARVMVRQLGVRGSTRTLRTYRYIQAVNALCRDEPFDIVHAVTPCLAAHVYQPRGGTFTETIARSTAMASTLGRPWRRLGRAFNVRQRFLRQLETCLLTKYQHRVYLAALSDYVRRQAVEGLGFPAARARVVFNGVDVAPLADDERATTRRRVREALGLREETPLVLFVAHNFRLKGLTELLRAAADGPPTWTLVVAGRDGTGPYTRLAARLRLGGRTHFVGTTHAPRDLYAAADVLAHPTWYDPCSRVVLEALSLGLPVVTTRYNGAAEAMQASRHGVVIEEPRDAAALRAGLERALTSELRTACRADAPQMCGRLSMARHARELKALYEGICATR